MKRTSKKLNTKLVGILIVVLTAVYLFASSAIVMMTVYAANAANITFEADHLSWGDVSAFDAGAYNNTNCPFNIQNEGKEYVYYTSTASKNQTTATQNGYKLYGELTIKNRSGITDGEALTTYTVDKFYGGLTAKTFVSADETGFDIPVVTTGGTCRYSVVPNSVGSYRIYVYSEKGKPINTFHYALLEDYESNNDFSNEIKIARTFNQVSGTNWYYTDLTVNYLSWKGYEVSLTPTNKSTSSSPSDNGAGTYAKSQSTVLNNETYYYNNWTVTEHTYNTVLAMEFTSDVKLGPVTKTGDTLSVTSGSDGTLEAINIFGEPVTLSADGTAIPHMPIYFTAQPSGDAQFTGFTDAAGKEVSVSDITVGDKTYTEYLFTGTAQLTAKWEKMVNFPTVQISGPKNATLHFYKSKEQTDSFLYGFATQYTFTTNYTDAVDATVQYSVTRDGDVVETGTLSKDGTQSVTLTTQWEDEFAVTFTSSYDGVEGSVTFTADSYTTGLEPVAKIGSTNYYTLEDALTASVSGNTVVLLKDYTFQTENRKAVWGNMNDGTGSGYTVRSGVTLIVPYAASYKYNNDSKHPYACEAKVDSTSGTGGAKPGDSNTYMTLTVPTGVNLTVDTKGIMAVGGTTNGVEMIAGGPHADVKLQSGANITVKGSLSSCGFIYGDGNLTAHNGSAVYVPFTVHDFRGGGYTVGSAGPLDGEGLDPITDEKAITPFMRYSFQAIQCDQRIHNGAVVIAYADLYANSSHQNSNSYIISSDPSNALLALTGEGAYVDISYDGDLYASTYPAVGKMRLEVNGDASYGGLELTVTAGKTVTVDTRQINFVLPYNFDVRIVSGTFTVPNSIMLLPGASVTVDSGATMNVTGALTVYDGLHDYTTNGKETADPVVLSTYAADYPDVATVTPGNNYPSSAVLMGGPFYGSGAADLIINGTLNLKSGSSLGGVVQTSSTGSARINTDASMGTSTTTQIGMTGHYSVNLIIAQKEYSYAGATTRTLTGQILDTATGDRINIQPGLTYMPASGSDKIDSYTYDLYYYSDSTSAKKTITENVSLILQGSWYNYDVSVYTVVDDQVSTVPLQYKFAHGTDLTGKGYYTDAACTNAATTVTSDADLFYKGSYQASVDWADGSEDTKYPTVRQAIKAAVNTGDRVVLQTDLTDFTELIAPGDGQDFIFDLNGHTVETAGILFTDQSDTGRMYIDLNGGHVKSYGTTSPILNLPEGNEMTLDLNGGTIEYGILKDADPKNYVTTNTAAQTAAAIVNGGKLVITDTSENPAGKISSGLVLDLASVTVENYVSLIRNTYSGDLEISNVDLEACTVENTAKKEYGTVIFNGYDARLRLNNVDISAPMMYAIYNYGGTIESIRDGSITGKNGIYNMNVRSGAQTDRDGYRIDHKAQIVEIMGAKINVSAQYGIYNRGAIGTIGGDTAINALRYAIYNDNTWYKDTTWNRYVQTETASRSKRTYYSDSTVDFTGITPEDLIAGMKGESGGKEITIPFIAQITDSASINATAASGTSVSVHNRGYIGRITGGASITTGYRNALNVVDGGYVGTIDGGANIYATNNYAVYINGYRNLEYSSTRSPGYKTPEYEIDYPRYNPSRVNTISGSATIGTAASYAIQVNGQLGSISGNVAISAKTYGIAVNPLGSVKSYKILKTWVDGTETKRENTYSYYNASIDSIGASPSDNVTITTSGAYGINNAGEITTIGPGTTISSSQYAIQNYVDHYNAYQDEIVTAADANVAENYLTQYTRKYDYLPATIGTIDGANITTTSTYAIRNYAHIGTIRNATVRSGSSSAYADYTIANIADGTRSGERVTKQYYLATKAFGTTTSQFNAIDTQTMNYAKATIDLIEDSTISGRRYVLYNGGHIGEIVGSTITGSGERAINNIGKTRTGITYAVTGPEFDSATGKYAATATGTSVYEAQCTIGTIGAGNTIQATTNTVFNSGNITNIDSGSGEKTRIIATAGVALYNYQGLACTGGYISAYIDLIQNTVIQGTTYAIKNGDGNANYTDVKIKTLGEGLVALATAKTGYGVHNTTNAVITEIVAGDYYSGAMNRDYAIYQPDDQKYPEGKSLTTETREVTIDETPYQCYYIDVPKHVHTYGDPVDVWTVDSETGLAKLTVSITCANCEEGTDGKVLSETVENISGTYDPGDCETKASTTYTATVSLNGQSLTFTHVAESGDYGDHSWSEWSEETAPTCTEAGLEMRKCTVCGEEETQEVKATGNHTEILDTVNSVPAGCETKGKNVYICELCGTWIREEELPVAGHGEEVLDTENSVAVDCEKDGLNVYKCKVCGVKLGEVIIPATGHSWVEDENAYTAPSCTAAGSQGFICQNNANHTKTEPIDMIPHTYIKENFAWAWAADFSACTVSTNCTECGHPIEAECVVTSVETVSPTETAQGKMTHTATVTIGGTSYSDDEYTVIPELGHNYVGEITQAATCEEPGVMTYTCQNEECTQRTYTAEIPATGHSWQKAESEDNKAPTCEEPGSQYYVCSNDANHTKTEKIEATGHSYTGVVTKEATCAETGIMTYTCANDPAHTYTEDIPTLAHSWGDWTEENAPTCTGAGLEMRECTVCGATETQEVKATGHGKEVLDTENSVAADCENDGLNVFVCPTCGETLREEEVSAIGHSWKEVESAYVAPSCEVPGSRSYVCDNDPTHEKTEEIPATGHNWKEEESAYVAPTCEEPGSRSYFCENDLNHEKTEEIPATGHSWDQGQVIQEATCDAVGTKLFTCRNDEMHTYTEEISALGHSYTNVVTNPSCTTEGYTTHTCQVCGDSYVDEHQEPTGHNYQVTGTIGATCTQPGSKTLTCTKCNDVKTETIEASGHNPAQPEFTWEEDLSSCSATSSCITCKESLPVNCVVNVVQKADKTVYTAVATVCGVVFTDTKEIPDIYEVKISWNQTGSAVYSEGIVNYTWNPGTMTYSSETTGTGWSGKSQVKFTIDNTGSNTGIVASFRYTPILTGTFSWENLTDDWDLTIEKGSSGQAGFAVTPDADAKPQKPEDGETTIVLGTITITLEKEIKQDGNVQ
ncbi:MAG: hypothetical protein IJN67_00515 [Oscillospiraceae bacterium]|nr:hypothetical protein [Oscillospiraceae bacterium]